MPKPVDPEPETVVLEPKAAAPGLGATEVVVHCSYKDSDT